MCVSTGKESMTLTTRYLSLSLYYTYKRILMCERLRLGWGTTLRSKASKVNKSTRAGRDGRRGIFLLSLFARVRRRNPFRLFTGPSIAAITPVYLGHDIRNRENRKRLKLNIQPKVPKVWRFRFNSISHLGTSRPLSLCACIEFLINYHFKNHRIINHTFI